MVQDAVERCLYHGRWAEEVLLYRRRRYLPTFFSSFLLKAVSIKNDMDFNIFPFPPPRRPGDHHGDAMVTFE